MSVDFFPSHFVECVCVLWKKYTGAFVRLKEKKLYSFLGISVAHLQIMSGKRECQFCILSSVGTAM